MVKQQITNPSIHKPYLQTIEIVGTKEDKKNISLEKEIIFQKAMNYDRNMYGWLMALGFLFTLAVFI